MLYIFRGHFLDWLLLGSGVVENALNEDRKSQLVVKRKGDVEEVAVKNGRNVFQISIWVLKCRLERNSRESI